MIISIINPKGGVGKSTLATNLAVEFLKVHPTKILELDMQRTAYFWSRLREQKGVQPPVDVELVDNARAVSGVCAPYQGNQDNILIADCGALDTDFNRAATGAADLVIVPCRPSQAEVFGLTRMCSILADLGKGGYILNAGAFPASKGKINDLEEYVGTLDGLTVMSTIVRYRAAYQHAFGDGRSVTEYGRDAAASYEIRSLSEEIEEILLTGGK